MLSENALSAFLALARTGSFQLAAKEMGVSNASFSRYIAQAEEDAGFPLFHRSRNNSQLTRLGQEFLPVAKTLREELDLYETRVGALRHQGIETLRVGCGPLTTRTLILPTIRAVLAQKPDTRFRVLVSAHGRPLDLLQQDQYDVFVGDTTYTPAAEGVELMVLQKRSVSFFAHPAHPVHDEAPCSVMDILKHPFASPHLHKHWKAKLIDALGNDQAAVDLVSTQPRIESDDYSFLSGLLAEPGFIVGGMPDVFDVLVATGKAREIPMKGALPWNICAARKTNNTSEVLDLFWAALRRWCAAS